jgi:hypothetical protein
MWSSCVAPKELKEGVSKEKYLLWMDVPLLNHRPIFSSHYFFIWWLSLFLSISCIVLFIVRFMLEYDCRHNIHMYITLVFIFLQWFSKGTSIQSKYFSFYTPSFNSLGATQLLHIWVLDLYEIHHWLKFLSLSKKIMTWKYWSIYKTN